MFHCPSKGKRYGCFILIITQVLKRTRLFFFFTYLKEQIFCINTLCLKGDEGEKKHSPAHAQGKGNNRRCEKLTTPNEKSTAAESGLFGSHFSNNCRRLQPVYEKKKKKKALYLLWAKLRCNAKKARFLPSAFLINNATWTFSQPRLICFPYPVGTATPLHVLNELQFAA